MREAMNAVIYRGMSISKAAEIHGVPRTTLNDHVIGKVLPGSKCGAPTVLSVSEEQDLVDFLIKSASVGCGRTRKEVIDIVSSMLSRRDQKPRSVTNGWWAKFIKRHPVLSLRTPATLSVARANASTRESVNNYFDILEKTLEDSGLSEQPALIYNMDETGFPLDPKPLKTIHIRGYKNPSSLSSGSKSQVTVVACVSAAGQAIPPMIIWARKTMRPELAIGEIAGTLYGLSEKGWMDSRLFHLWFKRHFLRYAPATRPLILLLDGHSSHYCPDTIHLAAEQGVIIFILPPNTTHLTQPLDKGVFGPFKHHWKQVCHDFNISHPGQVVNSYNFCQLFSKAWVESMTAVNIAAGFQTTGIYPIDREAVMQESCSTSAEDNGLKPLPRFTPLKHRTVHCSSLCANEECYGSCSFRKENALINIVDLKTPQVKTQPVRLPDASDRVLTSWECRQKLKEKQEQKEALQKAKELKKQQKQLKKDAKKGSKCKLIKHCSVCMCHLVWPD